MTSEVKYFNVKNGLSTGGIQLHSANSSITTTGLAATGNLNLTGPNVTLGSVANLHISGGTANYILTTDGSGTLSWSPHGNVVVDTFTGTGSETTFTLTIPPYNEDHTIVNYNGAFQLRNAYSISGSDIIFTDPPASGSTIEVTTINATNLGAGGGGGSALTVYDEGSSLSSSVTSIDFVGDGVTATHSGSAVTVTVGSSFPSRTTTAVTTSSIANAVTADTVFTGFKGYVLYKITTSAAAWVRLYTDTASRTADAGRSSTADPTTPGVIAETITTGSSTVLIAPGVYGFNSESSVSTDIATAITNLSGSTTTITVTLTLLQTEA